MKQRTFRNMETTSKPTGAAHSKLQIIKAPAVAVGIAVSLILLIGVGGAVFISSRREAAKNVLLHAVELGRNGAWDQAFALAHPDYRRHANLVNFKGDLSQVTNQVGDFSANIILKGGWNYVQVRFEHKNQPEWGVFFELREIDGQWRIADRGHWTSSNF